MSMFEVVAEGNAFISQEDTEANVKVALGKYYYPAPFADMLGRKLAMSNRYKARQIPGIALWTVLDMRQGFGEPVGGIFHVREDAIRTAERWSHDYRRKTAE